MKIYTHIALMRFDSTSGLRIAYDQEFPGVELELGESPEQAVFRCARQYSDDSIRFVDQIRGFVVDGPEGEYLSLLYLVVLRSNESSPLVGSWRAWTDLSSEDSAGMTYLRKYLLERIHLEPLFFLFLARTFPFSDLEVLYTSLKGENPDRRNFKKRILAIGLLDEQEEKLRRKVGRPASLYHFNERRYFDWLQQGRKLSF